MIRACLPISSGHDHKTEAVHAHLQDFARILVNDGYDACEPNPA